MIFAPLFIATSYFPSQVSCVCMTGPSESRGAGGPKGPGGQSGQGAKGARGPEGQRGPQDFDGKKAKYSPLKGLDYHSTSPSRFSDLPTDLHECS